MRHLDFPSYEYIKSLTKFEKDRETSREYRWLLFDTPVSVQGTISYNEDGEGYIFFDVWENYYTGQNDLGLSLKFNKTNYKAICRHAQEVFESFYKALDRDCSSEWEDYLGDG